MVGRLVAARREGLEYRLLRAPLSDGLGAHRLQLLNVMSCCALVALTVPVGTYAALAVQLTGSYRALLILFSAGLVGSVLVALVPLRRVRPLPAIGHPPKSIYLRRSCRLTP